MPWKPRAVFCDGSKQDTAQDTNSIELKATQCQWSKKSHVWHSKSSHTIFLSAAARDMASCMTKHKLKASDNFFISLRRQISASQKKLQLKNHNYANNFATGRCRRLSIKSLKRSFSWRILFRCFVSFKNYQEEKVKSCRSFGFVITKNELIFQETVKNLLEFAKLNLWINNLQGGLGQWRAAFWRRWSRR